ncbi:MAG: YggS family pyridoxal phosphate-dependent enzyme [Mariprofundales bacterium]
MDGLLGRYQRLKAEAARYQAQLICVSKYAPDHALAALIEAGARDFGESRPQQLRDRALRWPHCRWHMIGPLQRNKAKYIARYAASWLSVESFACAEVVASRREAQSAPLPVMIQIDCSGLAQHHGVTADGCSAFYRQLCRLSPLQVVGLMAMVPKGEGVAACVEILARLKETMVVPSMRHLCVGMSHDYQQALAAGSTMIRVGSALFGSLDIRSEPLLKE